MGTLVCTTPSGVVPHTVVYLHTDWCATGVVANPPAVIRMLYGKATQVTAGSPPCQTMHTHCLRVSDHPEPPLVYPGQVKSATERYKGLQHTGAKYKRLGHSENKCSMLESSHVHLKHNAA